jgi:3-oxoacyl-[acyl-carrier protein] reductase
MGVLEGKAAAVTGGGRGIGRGHCLHLAQQGAAVLVNDIDLEAAGAVCEEIAEQGGRAAVNTSDISTRDGARYLVSQCVEEFGALHVLVNNAGNARDRSFLKMTDDEFMSVVRVHQGGTFMCSQEAALRMREQGTGGAIVNTVSAAHFGNFGQTNYAGSKGAIASMTYTWALELARYGIRVNAISPAGTTRMSATYKGADGREIEMPFIDPTENGAAVAFLCSDHASGISGQIFGTGNGRMAILEHPRYGASVERTGGWSTQDLVDEFEEHFKAKLEPIGIMKNPYPFHDGIKPPGALDA